MKGDKILGRNTPYWENHRLNENEELEKYCSRHNKFFIEEDPWMSCTEEYFYKNKSNRSDGLHTWCKKCASKSSSIVINNNYDKFLETYDKYTKGPKHKAYRKKNRAEQIEKGQYKAWCDANPHKLKIYAEKHRIHDIEQSEWIANLKFFNNSCAYCGLPSEKHFATRKGKNIIMNLHKEHVEDEGYNDIRNCVPACTSCNSGKCRKTIDEFMKTGFVKGFTQERYNKIIQWTTEEYKKYITDKPLYRIKRKKKEGLSTYCYQLWSVDEKRNMIEVIATEDKKKDLDAHIERLFLNIY
jgi:hypothetical protein